MQSLKFAVATVAAGLMMSAGAAFAAPPSVGTVATLSSAPTVDGTFTGSEWSSVTPLAFISPVDASGTLQLTIPEDPAANSFLYTGIVPDASGPGDLFILADYLPRTLAFNSGELVGNFTLDINAASNLPPLASSLIPATVNLKVLGGATAGTYDTFLSVTAGGNVLATDEPISISIGITNGASPNRPAAADHLQIEMGLPLQQVFDRLQQEIPLNPITGDPLIVLNLNDYAPMDLTFTADLANDAIDPIAAQLDITLGADGGASFDVSNITQAPPIDDGGGPGPGTSVPLPPAMYMVLGTLASMGGIAQLRKRLVKA